MDRAMQRDASRGAGQAGSWGRCSPGTRCVEPSGGEVGPAGGNGMLGSPKGLHGILGPRSLHRNGAAAGTAEELRRLELERRRAEEAPWVPRDAAAGWPVVRPERPSRGSRLRREHTMRPAEASGSAETQGHVLSPWALQPTALGPGGREFCTNPALPSSSLRRLLPKRQPQQASKGGTDLSEKLQADSPAKSPGTCCLLRTHTPQGSPAALGAMLRGTSRVRHGPTHGSRFFPAFPAAPLTPAHRTKARGLQDFSPPRPGAQDAHRGQPGPETKAETEARAGLKSTRRPRPGRLSTAQPSCTRMVPCTWGSAAQCLLPEEAQPPPSLQPQPGHPQLTPVTECRGPGSPRPPQQR